MMQRITGLVQGICCRSPILFHHVLKHVAILTQPDESGWLGSRDFFFSFMARLKILGQNSEREA